MINQHVIDYLITLYAFFKGISISFFAAGFTIYFAVMKLTNKIVFSHSISHDFLDPSGKLKNFVLKNKRDKTYSITKLVCCYSDNNILVIKSFNPPLLLKPYEIAIVEFDGVSFWEDKKGCKYVPNFMNPFTISALMYGGGRIRCIKQNHSEYTNITIIPSTAKFDGIVLKETMKYILRISIRDEFKNIVILNNGWVINGNEYFRGANLLKNVQLNIPAVVEVLSSNGFDSIWNYYIIYDVENFMVRAVYDSRRLAGDTVL